MVEGGKLDEEEASQYSLGDALTVRHSNRSAMTDTPSIRDFIAGRCNGDPFVLNMFREHRNSNEDSILRHLREHLPGLELMDDSTILNEFDAAIAALQNDANNGSLPNTVTAQLRDGETGSNASSLSQGTTHVPNRMQPPAVPEGGNLGDATEQSTATNTTESTQATTSTEDTGITDGTNQTGETEPSNGTNQTGETEPTNGTNQTGETEPTNGTGSSVWTGTTTTTAQTTLSGNTASSD